MKIVLGTNVFVSGVFFAGPPHRILRAWREGLIRLVYSPEIVLGYQRVIADLGQQFPGINGQPFIDLVLRYGELVHPKGESGYSCRDLDDLKFLAYLYYAKARCLSLGRYKVAIEFGGLLTYSCAAISPRQSAQQILSLA